MPRFKNWVECDVPSCSADALENHAARLGWYVDDRNALCPVHRPTHGHVDTAAAAAGDDQPAPEDEP